MSDWNPPSVLAVGVSQPPESTSKLEVSVATSSREAIAMMRLLHFDLLLAGKDVPDGSLWSLLERVLTAWPQQRWVFVAVGITLEEEIQARALGSSLILNSVPDEATLCDVVQTICNRRFPVAASEPLLPTGHNGQAPDINSLSTDAL